MKRRATRKRPMKLEPATCPSCDGLVRWVRGGLEPLRFASEYKIFKATVHCDACDDDCNVTYRTNAIPPNLPPAGAHFFDRQVEGRPLPYYSPDTKVTAPKPKPVVETCTAFGYKCAWLAVKTAAAPLAKKLLGPKAPRASWADGIAAAYTGSIFVTPAVDGWVFVVSTQFFEDADDPESLRTRAGKTARFFGSDRVIGLNVAPAPIVEPAAQGSSATLVAGHNLPT